MNKDELDDSICHVSRGLLAELTTYSMGLLLLTIHHKEARKEGHIDLLETKIKQAMKILWASKV